MDHATSIRLPRHINNHEETLAGNPRRIIIIGGNGAGKSRFIDEMASKAPGHAYMLSSLEGLFPERETSEMAGSIDSLYSEAVKKHVYMRPDALSELEKLTGLLFADELSGLVSYKESLNGSTGILSLPLSPLDKVRKVWSDIFPESEIVIREGTLLFRTPSGPDLIPLSRLSRGEQTVLYYSAAILYAMPGALVFVDTPSMFLHHSIVTRFWNEMESLRPDCIMVYYAVNPEFIGSSGNQAIIWVKSFEPETNTWDYEVLAGSHLSENILVDLAGARRPVLFIEGDAVHSIDGRLYSIVFDDYTVRPLGSCNKVIESTRSFNDLTSIHRLIARGIVDRDRRTDKEVEYLRRKNILVPEVAEVENIFLHPAILEPMARLCGRKPTKVVGRVRHEVLRMFATGLEAQALEHVRHRIKRGVEFKIDSRFSCITALETHLKTLHNVLQPRRQYEELRRHFRRLLSEQDFEGVLKVFNHKPMLNASGAHGLLGFRSAEHYISAVLDAMRGDTEEAGALRGAVRMILLADTTEAL